MKTKKKLKTKNYKREFSAGGVVFRKFKIQNSKFKIRWLVAKHSGYKKWILPKGLIDPGESSEAAAVREVKEETGIKAKIVNKIKPAERYVYTFEGKRVFKVVQYYLMEYVSGDVKDHDWEMEEVGWVLFDEAKKRLDFSGQKKVLKQAKEMVEKEE